MDCKRGDIVTINLNPKKGYEIDKIRLAVIISNDDENKILDTVIVMPLSTSLLDDMEPFRIRIKTKEDSDVLINHVRAISKVRIGKKIASLKEQEYKKIVQNLCKNFI